MRMGGCTLLLFVFVVLAGCGRYQEAQGPGVSIKLPESYYRADSASFRVLAAIGFAKKQRLFQNVFTSNFFADSRLLTATDATELSFDFDRFVIGKEHRVTTHLLKTDANGWSLGKYSGEMFLPTFTSTNTEAQISLTDVSDNYTLNSDFALQGLCEAKHLGGPIWDDDFHIYAIMKERVFNNNKEQELGTYRYLGSCHERVLGTKPDFIGANPAEVKTVKVFKAFDTTSYPAVVKIDAVVSICYSTTAFNTVAELVAANNLYAYGIESTGGICREVPVKSSTSLSCDSVRNGETAVKCFDESHPAPMNY